MARSELGTWITGGSRSGPGHESPHAELYDHLLEVCLLLLLQETSATCRELREALRPLGFEQTTAVVGATLGTLASEGLVEPSDDHDAGNGVVYALTADGAVWLCEARTGLRRTEVVLGGFLARCSERFVTPA